MKKTKMEFRPRRESVMLIGFALLFFLSACGVEKDVDAAGNMITTLDNVAFTIGSRPIYFYALCIMSGIGLGYLSASVICKRVGFSSDDFFTLFIWGIIASVLGAKIYYYLFYDFASFIKKPWIVITDFVEGNGGLAIHGGLIAAAIVVLVFCRKKKTSPLLVGEVVIPGILIGQIIGRWGNFFNQEAHGGPIVAGDVAASRAFLEQLHLPKFLIDQMYISEGGVYNYMHPTFLYEGAWNAVGLIVLLTVRACSRKHYRIGDALAFYLVWYGIGRFGIESLRTDYLPVTLFGHEFRQAQVISVVMIILGITLAILLRTVLKTKTENYRGRVERLAREAQEKADLASTEDA